MSEPFNPYHHSLYYEIQENGEVINHHEYKPNRFWKRYDLDADGNVLISKVFEPKKLSWDEEKQHRLKIIIQANRDNILINHNHLSPIDEDVLGHLTQMGVQNYFTLRLDKKCQLSSYAIAYHTKKFINFASPVNNQVYSKIVNPEVLENLCKRIVISNEKIQTIKNCIHVAYEDLVFSEFDNAPKKQVKNSWNQIATEDKIVITNLLAKYGLS